MKDGLKSLFVLALLCLVAVSYHNTFSPPDALQTTLAMPIFYLMVLTFFVTFTEDIIKMKYFQPLAFFYLLVVLDALVCYALLGVNTIFYEIKDLTISLVAFCIGYNTKMSNKYLLWLFFAYGAILIFYASTSQIFNNIGGIIITDDYKIPSKNALGAMLSSYVSASLPLILSKEVNGSFKVISIIHCLAAVVVLLTIRARASTMTFFITMIMFVLMILKNRNLGHNKTARWSLLTIITVIILISMLSVVEPLGNYVYNSLYQNVESDITTGRMERNAAAISNFMNHMFLGTLGSNVSRDWVHNYLLRILSSYGIVFGFIFVYVYLYIIIKLIKRLLHHDCLSITYVGYWSMMPLFLLSFVEPIFPFAPGTAILFSYLLLGNSLKKNFR